MANDKKAPTPLELATVAAREKYRNAYMVFSNTPLTLIKEENKDHCEHLFDEMLKAIVLVQGEDSYLNRGAKDTKNLFLLNSLDKGNMLKYDKQLPEQLFLWEYTWNFKFPDDSFFENNEIFVNKETYKNFLILFLNRFFQRSIEEEVTMVDRVVVNTLIKLNVIQRVDPANEEIKSTFASLLREVLS